MDELILQDVPQEGTPANSAEFFLATVTRWSRDTGAELQIEGQDSPGTKRYKVMQTSRPLNAGGRYLCMKQSGTYIVLGELGMPTTRSSVGDLASTASLADVISKINFLLGVLRNQGIIYVPD